MPTGNHWKVGTSNRSHQRQRWKQHWRNRKPSWRDGRSTAPSFIRNHKTISGQESHEHEREPDITREEVQTALRALPNDKAPGIDETPIELWKSSGEEGVTLLWKLCDKIWRCKEWPNDWCRGIFMPIYKKGNVKECSNYRTINLMVHARKVLHKDHCLKNPTEILIRDQWGTFWLCERKGDQRTNGQHQDNHGEVQRV